jgi:hypothetical protein
MKMMLKHLGLAVVLVGFLSLTSCDSILKMDETFEEMNINPTQANQINPNYKLTFIQLRVSGERYENWRTNLIYSSTMVQHFATYPTYWSGDKYLYNREYSQSMWDRYYPNIARTMEDLLVQTAADPADVNLHSITRIMRVFMYHRLTDLYGDIPYSEAGKGFLEGITKPTYDTQESIYRDMLKELDEAGAALDASKASFGTGDLIFQGDVAKWKKFAYSMMLRLAMRMSEVDPAAAQQYVQKAVAGGVMQSNADLARVPHDLSGWTNGYSDVAQTGGEWNTAKISKTFMDWMLAHGDPRVNVFGKPRVVGAPPVGLPNGLSAAASGGANSREDDPSWVPCATPGIPAAGEICEDLVYWVWNPVFLDRDDPMMFQSYAEVELLLAEAAVRGWHSGNAATHFENGVRAAMEHLSIYGAGASIAAAEIDAYVAANPFDGTIKQIAEFYWSIHIQNHYEAFANYRRTGFPVLTPTNYPGNVTGGTIPRRLRGDTGEAVNNAENHAAAMTRQGITENNYFTVPMWWDKR